MITATEFTDLNFFVLVMKSFYKDQWLAAVKDEYNSLMENQIWILVDFLSGRRVIDGRWKEIRI